MVDKVGEVWRYWGHYGGSHGRYMAALGTVYWGYWGTYGRSTEQRVAVLGSSMVGVSEDAWRSWGVPLTPGTTQGGNWGIPWPLKQTRGIVPAGMYIA